MKKAFFAAFVFSLAVAALFFFTGQKDSNSNLAVKETVRVPKAVVQTTLVTVNQVASTVSDLGPDKNDIRAKYLADVAAGKGIVRLDLRESFSHEAGK